MSYLPAEQGSGRQILAVAAEAADKTGRLDQLQMSRETKMRGIWKVTHVLKALVEPDGIEPTTSCLQSTRSPN
jgi:hypothetical protein